MNKKARAFFRKPVLFLKNTIYYFEKDSCKLHAAALSFITILTLIPFLALIFAISKGLGIQSYLQDIIIQKITLGKQEIVLNILQYIENTNLKNLGTIGIVFLLLTAIRLLGTIEAVFNSIWDVKAQRRITRKISDYMTVVFLCPIFIFITFTFTGIALSSSSIFQNLLKHSVISSAYIYFMRLLPFLSIWVALSIFYMFMPNTKVKLSSGLLSGIIAGTIWQIFQWAYIEFQIGITRYNAIYGTFATIPVFFVWVYLNWVLILFGAELGYVFQNRKHIKQLGIKDKDDSLLELNELYGILRFLVGNFNSGKFPLIYEEIILKSGFEKSKIVRVIDYLNIRKVIIKRDGEIFFVKNPCSIKLIDVIPYREENSDEKSSKIFNRIINRDELDSYTLADIA
ncbi:MAG: YihY/virulence factor BrkB family protein [Candidatus Omnitrophica bacterium]|nr:YihY/virulence factor BrkB family protein [Candidatus Omnitrophota bacterium]